MPLKRGRSKKTISANIREMLHSYKATGRIGRTRPRNLEHARRIAAAAAYSAARATARKKRSSRRPRR